MCKILVTDHPVENRKKNFVKEVIEIPIPKEGAPQYIYRADTEQRRSLKQRDLKPNILKLSKMQKLK